MAVYNMNPGQSITATGTVILISVDIKKYGSPDFDIRAKIYDYVPINGESGFPLPNLLGTSTNVVAATDLTDIYAYYVFYFDNVAVSGQWMVVFEYENVVTAGWTDYAAFAVGVPDTIYAGGDFIYYDEWGDSWVVWNMGDLLFACFYCNTEVTTTTTTEQPRQ